MQILAYVSQVHNVVLPEDLVDNQIVTLEQVCFTWELYIYISKKKKIITALSGQNKHLWPVWPKKAGSDHHVLIPHYQDHLLCHQKLMIQSPTNSYLQGHHYLHQLKLWILTQNKNMRCIQYTFPTCHLICCIQYRTP